MPTPCFASGTCGGFKSRPGTNSNRCKQRTPNCKPHTPNCQQVLAEARAHVADTRECAAAGRR